MKKRLKKYQYGGDVLTDTDDTEAAIQRRMKQQAKEQALEGVYPEEMVMPGGLLRGAGRKMVAEAKELRRLDDLMSRPRIKNSLYAERIGQTPDTTLPYAMRKASQAEVDDIIKSGFMQQKQVPAGWKGKDPSRQKYFTLTDKPLESATAGKNLRVRTEKIPSDRAVRREDVELFDPVTGTFKPLKKGGKVTRGDGIARRGKTKGRFV